MAHPNAQPSKTAQVLRYFAQQYQAVPPKKGIPRKRLMKMAYLSDLYAREYLGHAVTTFQYYRFKFGPYDRSIEDVIEELRGLGLADVKTDWGNEEPIKRLVDSGQPIAFEFTAGEQEVLRHIATHYLRMPMEELLRDVVYPSLPMRQAPKMKQTLPMDAVDNSGIEAVGFNLEDILQAEAEIDAGKGAATF